MKKALLCIALVVILLLPGSSRAFVDLGQGDWFSGQNSLLVELLMTELDELANLTSILAKIKQVTQATNEALALARSTYRAYETVRDYTLDDLYQDTRKGMFKAFPDLRDIERDGLALYDQYKNPEGIMSYWGPHDYAIEKTTQKVLSHVYQATIWPSVFPDALARRTHNFALTPVEAKIWKIYERTGMRAKVAVEKTAMATMALKMEALVDEANKKKNLELTAQTAAAQLLHQQVVNSSESLDLQKAELAMKHDAIEQRLVFNKMFEEMMEDEAVPELLFGVGAF